MNQNKIEIIQNDYVFDRFFKKGEQFDYIGTETITTGCSCNGSLSTYNTYVVLINNVKYHIRADRASIMQ
jgi:hypothetical protein